MDRNIQVFIADSRDMAGSVFSEVGNWQLAIGSQFDSHP